MRSALRPRRAAPATTARISGRRLAVAVGAVLMLAVGSATAPASAGGRDGTASAGPAGLSTIGPDPGRLAGFFDAAVPGRLRAHHVPGATISVVRDGRTIFSKGYGLADVDRRTPFDPETSLVRIASISKLFTWTAVMQLVQDGRLDLHQDVNRYLRTFTIPGTYSRPITLEHLMSHTAGFEDRGIGIGARSKADVPPLGSYLADHIPARVRPAGQMTAYSNYGAALAGYIVSQVSGKPYEQYVQDHILGPLGMRHSTAFEPVPRPLAAGQAHSYEYLDGRYERIPFVFDKLVPDGSISATASDMARFMSAHLQDGRLGGTRVLAEPTARLMHRRSFAADPRIDGYAHGFKEKTINGHRTIMHDGSWEGFLSVLVLVPDQRLGFFVSVNSSEGIEAVAAVMEEFFDQFVPELPAAAPRPADRDSAASQARLAGSYRPTRHAESTIAKLLTLGATSRVRFEPDGRLVFKGRTWAPIGPRLYRQVGGTDRAAFVGAGTSTFLATDGPTYERVPAPETAPFNLAVLVGFAAIALTAVIGWPLAWAVRRLRGRTWSAPSRWRAARRLALLAAAGGLAFLGLLAATLAGDTGEFLYGAPAGFRALLVLPLACAALAVAAVVTTAASWRQSPVGVLVRVHQVIVLAGLAGLLWFCLQWNIFGWRFG